MKKLFVEKSVDINAPASEVWEVLTNPVLSKEWIKEWWPDFEILKSDWKEGSPVIWKVKNGLTAAQGKVTTVQPPTNLQFDFQVNDPSNPRQPESVIYQLNEQDGHTRLFVSVGDFGDTPEHEQCYPGAEQSWDKSLPKIKALAENIMQTQ
jgi:uncharacterized protein YndB with AHSA1/START domain